MRIAAAVTTYNRLESLKRCIAAIRAQKAPVDEIIVVNDVSSDGTRAWLDAQPDIVAIHQSENGGCATSFRTVLEAAFARGHDFAWAMDDDVFPAPDSLAILLATAEDLQTRGVKLGGLTAYQAQWTGDDSDPTRRIYLPWRLPSTLGNALRYRFMSPEVGIERGRGEPAEIDLYAFISTLFPRAAMAEIGFPRADFYYYGEDTDYALRLKRAGFKSYVVPQCVVEHAGGGFNAPTLLPPKANWRYYYMYRNQLALVRLHRDRLGFAKTQACRLRILLGAAKRLWLEARRANFGACRTTLMGLGDGALGRMGKRVAPG